MLDCCNDAEQSFHPETTSATSCSNLSSIGIAYSILEHDGKSLKAASLPKWNLTARRTVSRSTGEASIRTDNPASPGFPLSPRSGPPRNPELLAGSGREAPSNEFHSVDAPQISMGIQRDEPGLARNSANVFNGFLNVREVRLNADARAPFNWGIPLPTHASFRNAARQRQVARLQRSAVDAQQRRSPSGNYNGSEGFRGVHMATWLGQTDSNHGPHVAGRQSLGRDTRDIQALSGFATLNQRNFRDLATTSTAPSLGFGLESSAATSSINFESMHCLTEEGLIKRNRDAGLSRNTINNARLSRLSEADNEARLNSPNGVARSFVYSKPTTSELERLPSQTAARVGSGHEIRRPSSLRYLRQPVTIDLKKSGPHGRHYELPAEQANRTQLPAISECSSETNHVPELLQIYGSGWSGALPANLTNPGQVATMDIHDARLSNVNAPLLMSISGSAVPRPRVLHRLELGKPPSTSKLSIDSRRPREDNLQTLTPATGSCTYRDESDTKIRTNNGRQPLFSSTEDVADSLAGDRSSADATHAISQQLGQGHVTRTCKFSDDPHALASVRAVTEFVDVNTNDINQPLSDYSTLFESESRIDGGEDQIDSRTNEDNDCPASENELIVADDEQPAESHRSSEYELVVADDEQSVVSEGSSNDSRIYSTGCPPLADNSLAPINGSQIELIKKAHCPDNTAEDERHCFEEEQSEYSELDYASRSSSNATSKDQCSHRSDLSIGMHEGGLVDKKGGALLSNAQEARAVTSQKREGSHSRGCFLGTSIAEDDYGVENALEAAGETTSPANVGIMGFLGPSESRFVTNLQTDS